MQFTEQQIREAFPREPWPHQLRGLVELFKKLETKNSVVFCSPTGGGKGICQTAILNLLHGIGEGAVLYNVRRSLTDQTYERLTKDNIHCGVRSAAHKHLQNLNAMVQVASLQTDINRVLAQEVWDVHDCALAIVDEAHISAGAKAQELFQRYLAKGTKVIGVTGTPIDLSGVYSDIVVAGTNSELRACKAHVPARVFSVHEMDTSKIKPVQTGEFSEGDIRRECWNQAIVGYIVEDYKRLNPDRRPAMAAAPGIGESVWLSERFAAEGLRVLHLDCNEVIANGERYKNDPEGIARGQALNDFRAGEYDMLCNCEVVQQGIDITNLYHLILARPYGSLANYTQVVGRVIRYSESTPDHVIVQDHGGSWWRHGSPNEDRDWESLFYKTEKEIAEERRIKSEQKEKEPIVCVGCGALRNEGIRCPACGVMSDKTKRIIVEESGQLIEHTGRIYKPPRVPTITEQRQKQWDGLYFNATKHGKDTSFKALKAQYKYKYKEWPPENLKNMPINPGDWTKKTSELSREALR